VENEKVSILFGTVDRPENTLRLIESIEKYTSPVDYEIIVVDGSLEKHVLKYVMNKKDTRIKYLEDTERKGYSYAYNQGASLSQGDFIIWLNDDCLVTPLWAEKVITYMNTHHKVGIGGISFNEGTKTNIRQTILGRYAANFGCIKRNLWECLKGLDETFHSYGAETDLCFRVLETGLQVVPVPDVCIEHFRINDQNHKKMLEYRQQAIALFYKIWRPRLKLIH